MNTTEILQHAHSIILFDWPTRDVPESLIQAGLHVFVKGGPAPDDFFAYDWRGNQLVQQRIGHPLERADIVYSYRPLSELPGIVDLAKSVHARIVWTQSGLCSDGSTKDPRGCWLSNFDHNSARIFIQSAGFEHISQPYIADVARQLIPTHP